MYLSMLDTAGSLRADAQALALKDDRFVRKYASSFRYKAQPTPAELEADPDPGPAGAMDTEALLDIEEIQADQENMGQLEARGTERNALSQAQMAQSYANRKKPRNKRVEPMEVGALAAFALLRIPTRAEKARSSGARTSSASSLSREGVCWWRRPTILPSPTTFCLTTSYRCQSLHLSAL